jgi:hypothetical protein
MSEKVKPTIYIEEGENVFGIFGRFQREARKNGWSQEDIDEVLDKAKAGDYENAVAVIKKNVEVEEL